MYFEGGDEEYDGSLFAIDELKDGFEGESYDLKSYGWDCMAVGACDADDDSTNCLSFEPLMEAGRVYL